MLFIWDDGRQEQIEADPERGEHILPKVNRPPGPEFLPAIGEPLPSISMETVQFKRYRYAWQFWGKDRCVIFFAVNKQEADNFIARSRPIGSRMTWPLWQDLRKQCGATDDRVVFDPTRGASTVRTHYSASEIFCRGTFTRVGL